MKTTHLSVLVISFAGHKWQPDFVQHLPNAKFFLKTWVLLWSFSKINSQY